MHPDTARMLDNKTAGKKTLDILSPLEIPLQVNNSALLETNSQYWRHVQGGAPSPGGHTLFLFS